jgi:ankyrin repeat protein
MAAVHEPQYAPLQAHTYVDNAPTEHRSCSDVYSLACELIQQHTHRELHKFLTSERKTLDIEEVDGHGRTLLMHAALCGSHKCAEVILEFGARIDCADGRGNTSLHNAYQNKHIPVAVLLIRHGAEETVRNAQGQLPRDVCARDKFKVRVSTASTGSFPPAAFHCPTSVAGIHNHPVLLLLG